MQSLNNTISLQLAFDYSVILDHVKTWNLTMQ